MGRESSVKKTENQILIKVIKESSEDKWKV